MSMGGSMPATPTPASAPAPRRDAPLVPRITMGRSKASSPTGKNPLRIPRTNTTGAPKTGLNIARI